MNLLESIQNLLLPVGLYVKIVVVDNDIKQSAEQVVLMWRERSSFDVLYVCEPEQNIALARNCAIRHSGTELIAFVDDDEQVTPNWLLCLYSCIKKFDCDGVLGPVLPHYSDDAPYWLKKGNFFDRKRMSTGAVISERDGRTGNALLKTSLFANAKVAFDPIYGRTGGEDSNFFRRQMELGKRFVWCDEAVVCETVPRERWLPSFHLRKFFRIGTNNGHKKFSGIIEKVILICRALASFIAYTIYFPFSLLFGKHKWLWCLMKLSYNTGFLTAVCGLVSAQWRKDVSESHELNA
jgi:succinoglycan biosynthesis protein ExoM